MKSFIFTSIIFVLLVVLIAINHNYIENVTNEMKNITEKIASSPDDCETNLEKLYNIWEKNKKIINLTTSYNVIGDVSSKLSSIKSYYESGYKIGFLKEIANLKEAISDISRLEKISIQNIF